MIAYWSFIHLCLIFVLFNKILDLAFSRGMGFYGRCGVEIYQLSGCYANLFVSLLLHVLCDPSNIVGVADVIAEVKS